MWLGDTTRKAMSIILEIEKTGTTDLVSASTVARNQKLSQSITEYVMYKLKDNGILNSTRGVYGGYSLAKPLANIKVVDLAWIFKSNPPKKRITSNTTPETKAVINFDKSFTLYVKELAYKESMQDVYERVLR